MATGWSKTDLILDAQVSGTNNEIVKTVGSGFGALRSATGHSSGKWYFEFTPTGTLAAAAPSMGVASSQFDLFNLIGYGTPSDSVGIYFADDNQEIVIDNVWSSINFPTSPMNTGEIISICVDLDNNLYWFITPQYSDAFGASGWNGSPNADPATGAGGLSGTITKPAFIAWHAEAAAAIGTLNTGQAPFTRAMPAGYSTWDTYATPPIPLSLSEFLTPTDTLARATGPMAAVIHETAFASDVLTSNITYALGLSDTDAATDALAQTSASMPAAIEETAVSVDSFAPAARAQGVLTDALNPVDDFATVGSFTRALADTAAATDGVAVVARSAWSLSDIATTTDALSPSASAIRALADTLTATDTYSGSTVALHLADAITPIDIFVSSGSVVVLRLTDANPPIDMLASAGHAAWALTDALTPADTYMAGTLALRQADTAAAADVLSASSRAAQALTDATVATDAYATGVSALRLSDVAVAADAIASSGRASRAVVDTLAPSDALSTGYFALAISDLVTVADAFNSGIHLRLSDNAAATEILSFSITLPPIRLADVLVLSDVLSWSISMRPLPPRRRTAVAYLPSRVLAAPNASRLLRPVLGRTLKAPPE